MAWIFPCRSLLPPIEIAQAGCLGVSAVTANKIVESGLFRKLPGSVGRRGWCRPVTDGTYCCFGEFVRSPARLNAMVLIYASLPEISASPFPDARHRPQEIAVAVVREKDGSHQMRDGR